MTKQTSKLQKKDYFLLMMAVGIVMGYTYSLDTPQSLQIPLRTAPYNFTTQQFNLLYFSTFILIAFFQIPFGIVVDRNPIKITLLILLGILLASQVSIAILFSFTPGYYKIGIYILRSLFGLAGQGIYTIQCVIMSVYAENQYEFLAGLALSFPYMFDAVNSLVTTAVYDQTQSIPVTWYIGAFVCFLSLLFGIWMVKSVITKQKQIRQSQHQSHKQQNIALKKDKSCLKQIKVFDLKFWVIVAFIFFTQISLGPFNDNLNQLIVQRFNIRYTDAGKMLLIPYLFLTLFTLLIGKILKKRPSFRRISMLISTSLYLFAHFCLYFLPNSKITDSQIQRQDPKFYHFVVISFFLLTMSLNLAIYFAAITTSIPFMVHENVLGTAWGVAGSVVGLSQCFIPLLFGYIIGPESQEHDLSQNYQKLSGLGVLFAFIPLLFSIWINYASYEQLDLHYNQIQDLQKSKIEQKNGTQTLITSSF